MKEGDRVRKNQVVARIENTQASADVNAQQAAIASAEADSAAAEAGLKAQDDFDHATQVATLERYKSELDRAKVFEPGPLRADVERKDRSQAGLRPEEIGLRFSGGQRAGE